MNEGARGYEWMASWALYENTGHEEEARLESLVVRYCRGDRRRDIVGRRSRIRNEKTHLELLLELVAQPGHIEKVVDGTFIRVVRPQKLRAVGVV